MWMYLVYWVSFNKKKCVSNCHVLLNEAQYVSEKDIIHV